MSTATKTTEDKKFDDELQQLMPTFTTWSRDREGDKLSYVGEFSVLENACGIADQCVRDDNAFEAIVRSNKVGSTVYQVGR